jgi:hypothetical protein
MFASGETGSQPNHISSRQKFSCTYLSFSLGLHTFFTLHKPVSLSGIDQEIGSVLRDLDAPFHTVAFHPTRRIHGIAKKLKP